MFIFIDSHNCLLFFVIFTQAYCYFGDNLIKLEKCGEAIRCSQESFKRIEILSPLIKEYFKMKSYGSAPKQDQTAFFQRIKANLTRIKDKCERENNLM